jgi:hypothetical protein
MHTPFANCRFDIFLRELAHGNTAVLANAAYFLSWERRRLGGSLSKNRKKHISRICSEIAIAGSWPAGRRRSQGSHASRQYAALAEARSDLQFK